MAAVRRRDAILNAVSLAAERFLHVRDWRQTIDEVLARLGEATEVSRVIIFECGTLPGDDTLISRRYEWRAAGVEARPDEALRDLPLRAMGFARWVETLERGEFIAGLVSGLPAAEQAALRAQQIRSIAAVPIFVENQWWGFIGFDECTTERRWEQAEIEALVVAARIVGEAIQRERTEAALRASEARYRTLAESAHDSIYILGRDLRLQYVNEFGAKGLGLSPAEAVGKTLHDLFPPAIAQTHVAAVQHVLATGETLYREASGRYAGREVWEGTQLVPLRDEAGGIAAVFGISRDATERKRAEEALRESEERLRLAQKMEAVGLLAGGIAHDFNNLLTAINGYADMALDGLDAASPVRQDVTEIRKAGDRAASLTRQLLAFSRKQMLQPRALDLGAVLADAETMLRRTIGEQIRLVTATAPDLAPVFADPSQVVQILMNLAINARDALPEGGDITIDARNAVVGEAFAAAHAGAKAGPFVLLTVSDNGRGMSGEVKAHIFEPFFTTKGLGRGTGLGLSTVYGIVQQSGGFIEVESEVETGTTFRIFLPLANRPADPPVGGAVVASPARRRETVLVVEDEPSVHALISKVLGHEGFVVLDARDPHHALDIATKHDGPIDALVTDVVMPLMNGHALATRIVAERPAIRTLLISGYAVDALPEQVVAGPTGQTLFLQKPFTAAALVRALQDLLTREKAG